MPRMKGFSAANQCEEIVFQRCNFVFAAVDSSYRSSIVTSSQTHANIPTFFQYPCRHSMVSFLTEFTRKVNRRSIFREPWHSFDIHVCWPASVQSDTCLFLDESRAQNKSSMKKQQSIVINLNIAKNWAESSAQWFMKIILIKCEFRKDTNILRLRLLWNFTYRTKNWKVTEW